MQSRESLHYNYNCVCLYAMANGGNNIFSHTWTYLSKNYCSVFLLFPCQSQKVGDTFILVSIWREESNDKNSRIINNSQGCWYTIYTTYKTIIVSCTTTRDCHFMGSLCSVVLHNFVRASSHLKMLTSLVLCMGFKKYPLRFNFSLNF